VDYRPEQGLRPSRCGDFRAAAGACGDLLRDACGILGCVSRQALDTTFAAAAIREGESLLTPREHGCWVAAATHVTAAEIAAELHLSEGTVRNHVSASIRKLGVRNRGDAIDLANKNGWL